MPNISGDTHPAAHLPRARSKVISFQIGKPIQRKESELWIFQWTLSRTPRDPGCEARNYGIPIKCDKPGFKNAEYLNHSGLSSMVAANAAADLILTAGISSIMIRFQ
jgi:hypothetical protein